MGIAEVLTLAGMLIGQFSLIWWRLGQVEQQVKNHCEEHKTKVIESLKGE